MNIRKTIAKVLPHIAIIIAGMLIVFFVIDRFNKPMGFMTNEFHKQLTFFLSLFAIGESIYVISNQRRKERRQAARQKKLNDEAHRHG